MLKTTIFFSLAMIIFGYLYVPISPNLEPTRHIFYIHGRIIEQQGQKAYSPQYGYYEFDSIVSALKIENSIVYAEVRTENVEPLHYAHHISDQIDSLIENGIQSTEISVVGASKVAIIVSHVSHINENPINYIFLAGNNDHIERDNDWKFHGNVLCIYEYSDTIAGKNYDYWVSKNHYMKTFEQLELNTGLGHGFLYKPLEAWLMPTQNWILRQEIN